MPRRKRSPLHCHEEAPTEPFTDSAEAWFWFARCQLLRRDGARLERSSGQARRPCDPDDIYRIALTLHREGRLSDAQLRVLARYGSMLRPPDERLNEEAAHAPLWHAALDRLSTPLVAKGIVCPADYRDFDNDNHRHW